MILKGFNHLKLLFLTATIFISLVSFGYAEEKEVHLQWDKSIDDPYLTYYKIYYGTASGVYFPDPDKVTHYSYNGTDWIDIDTEPPEPHPPFSPYPFTVDKSVTEIYLRLSDNTIVYYFAVKAVDTRELESDYSNEVFTFGILVPLNAFFINPSNYLDFTVSGGGKPGAYVELFADTTYLGGITADGTTGDWSISVNFTAIPAGGFELIAKSEVLISRPVIGFARGDVVENLAIDSGDAIKVLRYSVGLETLTDGQKWAGNVTNKSSDDDIDSGDAIKILRYSVGLITDFK